MDLLLYLTSYLISGIVICFGGCLPSAQCCLLLWKLSSALVSLLFASCNMLSFRKKVFEFIPNVRAKIKLPEKFKGTIIERGVKYFEGLLHDYKEVLKFIVQETHEKPLKTSPYYGSIAFFIYSLYNNPTELEYRDRVIHYQNLFGMVGKPVRNPGADVYLKTVENWHNFGLMRRLSLGVFSIMWIDNYDPALGLYKAQCNYIKPKYLTFHERIIDIGFLNRFWILEQKMKDYDVNPNEWMDFSRTEYVYRNKVLSSI